MRKKGKFKKQHTKYQQIAKKLERNLSQYKKKLIYPTTWAGFRCPQCASTSTESHGYVLGGCSLKCYQCGANLPFEYSYQIAKATHSKYCRV